MGMLALVGGEEWSPGCEFDAHLLEESGGTEVLVLPTASAYERPERKVMAAAEWFAGFGARVEGLMVLSRNDAEDVGMADVVRRARFVYLSGGSAMHLRSVLKGSKVFEALRQASEAGAVVAGSSGGGMVLTDPMVDPRGGALTVGLGLVRGVAMVPYFGDTDKDVHGEKLHRSVALAPATLPVVGVPRRTALWRSADGSWESSGPVAVFLDQKPASLSALR